RSVAGLPALAVDLEPHPELLDVGDFIPCHQPRTERAKGVVRLALGPLAAALLLEVALGDVVADAIAGDMVERIGLRNVLRLAADDGSDLDLPVELGGAARLLDGIVRARQRGVGLDE